MRKSALCARGCKNRTGGRRRRSLLPDSSGASGPVLYLYYTAGDSGGAPGRERTFGGRSGTRCAGGSDNLEVTPTSLCTRVHISFTKLYVEQKCFTRKA
eukprot:5635836-Pleurochrysis_carterae.AAC.3